MRKILSIFAAMLVAIAVNAQTDFAGGYNCTADAAVLVGTTGSSFGLNTDAEPHYVFWSDRALSAPAAATWEVQSSLACYVSVSLDLGPVVGSNKHIFEVRVYDANGTELGMVKEAGENTDSEKVKPLDGTILIPGAGTYKVELVNNRDWGKGAVKNVILTYAGSAPVTDFAAPGYSCTADDAVLEGTTGSSFDLNTDADPHYIFWSDRALSNPAAATWSVMATRGCYVSVTLDLGPVVGSNKHIFEVSVKNAKGVELGVVKEAGENTDANMLKVLDGTILLPTAGSYTVELINNRDWGKGSIKNVVMTYVADAPTEIIEVTSVTINKTELALDIEEVEQLSAVVSPEDATDPTVKWESSEPTVATVSEDGFVTAISAGTAIISAKAGEQTANCLVTVAAAAIPDVDFSEPYVLAGKVAHLEGAIWKMYTSETYKLYGDGGHNKNYGNALWTINVTKPCVVTGMLNGVEGGHLFELDLYKGEEFVATIAHPEGEKWSKGEIALEGTLTFATAGNYTLKLRNTQEWSSGKVAGITLTYEADVPAEPKTIYFNSGAWASEAGRFAVYCITGESWVDLAIESNEENLYKAEIPGTVEQVVFCRMNPETTENSWDNTWNQTEDLMIPEGKDLYTITGWGEGWGAKATGEWSKYGEVIPEVKFYVAGSMTDWDNNKIPVYADTYTFENLAAGKYQMKVVDGDWLGIDALTEVAGGLYKDQDNNICFILAEDGNVTVTYTAEAFTLAGNFVAPEVQLIGISGWDASTDAIALTPAEDKKSSSVKLNLTGEWYDFKVIRAGEWLGKVNEGSDNYRIWAEHNWVDALVRDYDGLKAISLQPNGAGDYIFTYDYETGKLTVTFPGEPTAIENTNAAVKAVKRIENGQMIIIKNGVKFNAIGTVVK